MRDALARGVALILLSATATLSATNSICCRTGSNFCPKRWIGVYSTGRSYEDTGAALGNARPARMPAREVAGDCRRPAAGFLPFFPKNSKGALRL